MEQERKTERKKEGERKIVRNKKLKRIRRD